jgi:hypothetical protein
MQVLSSITLRSLFQSDWTERLEAPFFWQVNTNELLVQVQFTFSPYSVWHRVQAELVCSISTGADDL